MPEGISSRVLELITARIDSVAQMEALLLLRQHRQSAWTAAAVAERIYVTEEVAGRLLAALSRRELVQRDGATFRYGPASPELADTVDELAATYRKRLIAITELIHTKGGANLQLFADVFRLRKGD